MVCTEMKTMTGRVHACPFENRSIQEMHALLSLPTSQVTSLQYFLKCVHICAYIFDQFQNPQTDSDLVSTIFI